MDLKEIKELIKTIDKSNLTEFEYECENERVYLSKQAGEVSYISAPQPQAVQQAPAPSAAPAPQVSVAENSSADTATMEGTEITSPMVGTFYEAPSPGASPFVKVGDTVSKGQTLCIIEAMKIMNEIEAEFDCKILKVLGVNGKPVEYGEVIFIVEPV
jgi:acetyl-CoA carboxylase biotin carboxyl carrier protein